MRTLPHNLGSPCDCAAAHASLALACILAASCGPVDATDPCDGPPPPAPGGDTGGDTMGDPGPLPDPCDERFDAATVADALGCESIQSLNLDGSDLTELFLPNLRYLTGGSMIGAIQVVGNPLLTSVHLPALETADALSIADNPLLASVHAPLVTIRDETGSRWQMVIVERNPALASLSLPGLTRTHVLTVGGNGLESLAFGALMDVGELVIRDEPALPAISMPAIECIRTARIEDCPLLRQCDVDALRSAPEQTCTGHWVTSGLAACE